MACASLHHSSLYIFAYVSFTKQLCTLLFLLFFPCLAVIIAPSTAQPHQLPDGSHSQPLFLSRTLVKHVTFADFSAVTTGVSAEQLQATLGGDEEDTRMASSPSPDRRSQPPEGSDSDSSLHPLDTQPIVLSDDNEEETEGKDSSVLSSSTRSGNVTSII